MLATILPQAAMGSTVILDTKIAKTQNPEAEPQTVIEETSAPCAPTPSSAAFDLRLDSAGFAPPPAPQTESRFSDYSFATIEQSPAPEAPSPEPDSAARSEPKGSEPNFVFSTSNDISSYADLAQPMAAEIPELTLQHDEAQGDVTQPNWPSFAAEALQPAPPAESPAWPVPRALETQEDAEPTYSENRGAALPSEFSTDTAQPLTAQPLTAQPLTAQPLIETEASKPTGNLFVVPENQQLLVREEWPAANPEPQYQLQAPITDELVNPWDNSLDNYPVLMVKEEKRPLTKTVLVLAAVALLALTAAGYFIIYKPFTSTRSANSTSQAGDQKPSAAPVKGPEPAPVNPPPALAQSGAALPDPVPPETKPGTFDEAKPESAEIAGQGKVSLQAASFPNEQGAKELSEKLIRSGIPAYIVAADLAGKGRWFRVRVGRFMSAAEAQRFAEQAKQRARATGLNIQLVVCDYNNP